MILKYGIHSLDAFFRIHFPLVILKRRRKNKTKSINDSKLKSQAFTLIFVHYNYFHPCECTMNIEHSTNERIQKFNAGIKKPKRLHMHECKNIKRDLILMRDAIESHFRMDFFSSFLPSLRIVCTILCTLKGATCIKQQASAAKTLSTELNTLASAVVEMNR